MRIPYGLAALPALSVMFGANAQTVPHDAVALAERVMLVPGSLWNDEALGPDGNTVIFRADDGDVVLDSGRHRQHADDILRAMHGRPLVALLNSHWHLDHTSNNFVLLRKYPQAELVATDAVDGALSGFLARSRVQAGKTPPVDGDAAARRARFEWVLDHPDYLRTKIPLAQDVTRRWKGLALDLRVARQAATAADLWVYDPAHRLVASGDLVTLPAPFLDTACADGWIRALASIDAVPFDRLVPGHGRVLSHAEFSRYRAAFSRLVACARDGEASACAMAWASDVAPLLESKDERGIAKEWTEAYFREFLAPGVPQLGRYCVASG